MGKIYSKSFYGVWNESKVTSSVTNYCCQEVISKVIIILKEYIFA